MTAPSAAPAPAVRRPRPANAAEEHALIHLAACRYRRQGLVCSACFRAAEAWREFGGE